MDYPEFDLLGDPVPEGFKGRGRPPHTPTDEKRKLVMALWAKGENNAYCAAALGITEPCFNRHYFKKSQRHQRHEARARLDAMELNAVLKGVEEGNMQAVKRLREIMREADLKKLSKEIGRKRAEDAAEDRKLGKKEQQLQDAAKVGGLYAPYQASKGSLPN